MLRHTFAVVLTGLVLSTLIATDAKATAQRTFVASYGVPANTAFNCSINKPCRAFSEAISVTTSGGEVIVLDSGGYGPVTITQSVSIIAPPGVYAGISVFSGDGVTVAAGLSHKVVLRGLTINGQGGQNGIRFLSGAELHVDRCSVSNMNANGLELKASGSLAFVLTTQVYDNGQSGIYVEGGMLVDIEGVSARRNLYGIVARSGPSVSVRNSAAIANANEGFGLDAATANVSMVVASSVSARNSVGINMTIASGMHAYLTVQGSVAERNLLGGITDNGSLGGGTLTIEDSKVIGNGKGIVYGGADVRRATLARNVVEQNHGEGITLTGTTDAILAGNVVTANGTGVFAISFDTTWTRGDNTIGNNGTDLAGVLTPLAGQ